ncbi:unnamed protein product [Sympodiomycopsis kandeliae]
MEEAIFFLGSIYSTIISHISHFLNRFSNLLLSPLFKLDGNVPSRICDDQGACYRPKDRLMQKKKTDERIKRAEYAARGLDPRLALRPKESRNASSTALVVDEKMSDPPRKSSSSAPFQSKTMMEKTDNRPLWVMGNIPASTAKEQKRRSLATEKVPLTATNRVLDEKANAEARRKRRESAPAEKQYKTSPAPKPDMSSNYRYEVLATSATHAELARKPRGPTREQATSAQARNLPAGTMDGSLVSAADRIKHNHRRSLQVEGNSQSHQATRPGHATAVVRGVPKARGSLDVRRSLDHGGPTAGQGSSSPPSASAAGSAEASPRGSIADLASAAANSKKNKDRKAWRGEISKVAKSRVTPNAACAVNGTPATMGKFGGSPLTTTVTNASMPNLNTFEKPFRAQTFT